MIMCNIILNSNPKIRNKWKIKIKIKMRNKTKINQVQHSQFLQVL